MAVNTTGSTLLGLNDGLVSQSNASGTYVVEGVPKLLVVNGDPNGVVTSTTLSGIAYDISTGEYYIGLGTNMSAGGSTWRVLV